MESSPHLAAWWNITICGATLHWLAELHAPSINAAPAAREEPLRWPIDLSRFDPSRIVTPVDNKLKQYSSLDDALTQSGVPHANRALIHRFVEGIGIAAYYETTGYIKAVRSAGGPDLRIASGWSNGFVSEAEICDVLGDVDRWLSDERVGLWGVSHPENQIGNGGGGPNSESVRSYGTCSECFLDLPATGQCNCQ
jgi:hypothetical protein